MTARRPHWTWLWVILPIPALATLAILTAVVDGAP